MATVSEINTTSRQMVEEILEKFTAFLDNHQWVARVNTVSFFTEEMWERIVVPHFGDVAREIVRLTETEMARLPAGQLPPQADEERGLSAVHTFINDCVDHRLENTGILCEVDSVLNQQNTISKKDLELCHVCEDCQTYEQSARSSVVKPKVLMNIKKSHEVEEMSHFSVKLARFHQLQKVVDIGSGKGYLGQYLSLQYGLDVIGIDSSDSNTHGARDRNNKLQKMWEGITRHNMNIQQSSSQLENPRDAFRELYTRRTRNLKKMQNFLNHPEDEICRELLAKEAPSGSKGLNMLGQSEGTSEASTSEMTNKLPISQPECSSSGVHQGHMNMHEAAPQSTGTQMSPEITDNNDGSGLSEDLQKIGIHLNDDQDSQHEQNSPIPTFRETKLKNSGSKESNAAIKDSAENAASISSSPHGKNDRIRNAARFCSVTAFVEPTTSLASVVSGNAKEAEVSFMITGLHTCGDLASSTLRLFVHNDMARVLLNVGCCYQKLSEEFETGGWHVPETKPEVCGFPMSHFLRSKGTKVTRSARMLASMAADRIATSQVVPAMGLFYRSVLQVLLQDHYRLPMMSENVGKLAPKCRTFLEYARKALRKLKFDDSKLSDAEICAYAEHYQPYYCQLQALNQLRVALSPTIEGLFLLDRLCYLQEQENICYAALVRLFDPVTSPRCYAVLATR